MWKTSLAHEIARVASEWSDTFGATFPGLTNRRKNLKKNSENKKDLKWHKFQVLWIYVIFSLLANRKTNLGNTRHLMEWRGVIPYFYLWRGLYFTPVKKNLQLYKMNIFGLEPSIFIMVCQIANDYAISYMWVLGNFIIPFYQLATSWTMIAMMSNTDEPIAVPSITQGTSLRFFFLHQF